MNLCTKRFGSPSASKLAERCRQGGAEGRGYALLILMMVATVLLVSLTAALPSIYTAGQREREEELIFRGNEYARAIVLFRRQFNRFPNSVKELLQTNGIRFLRRAYPDPMSRKGKWRFIHANAAGVLIDSQTMGPRRSMRGKGQSSLVNDSVEATAEKPGSSDELDQETQEELQSIEKTLEEEEREDSLFSSDDVQGAFIAGVASSSRRESIRVWNNHNRYNEWEFLGMQMNALGGQPVSPAQSPAQTTPGAHASGLPSPTGTPAPME